MPVYEWRCKSCGTISASLIYGTIPPCEVCSLSTSRMVRRYSFHTITSFQPHFNASLGRWVTSQADFNEGLKHASEAATARTGIPHNFTPAESADRDRFGITPEAVEEYESLHYNEPLETRL